MQEWPEGTLINPISLCDFKTSAAPAMHRVFGTVLIASSDAAASQVLARLFLLPLFRKLLSAED